MHLETHAARTTAVGQHEYEPREHNKSNHAQLHRHTALIRARQLASPVKVPQAQKVQQNMHFKQHIYSNNNMHNWLASDMQASRV